MVVKYKVTYTCNQEVEFGPKAVNAKLELVVGEFDKMPGLTDSVFDGDLVDGIVKGGYAQAYTYFMIKDNRKSEHVISGDLK